MVRNVGRTNHRGAIGFVRRGQFENELLKVSLCECDL